MGSFGALDLLLILLRAVRGKWRNFKSIASRVVVSFADVLSACCRRILQEKFYERLADSGMVRHRRGIYLNEGRSVGGTWYWVGLLGMGWCDSELGESWSPLMGSSCRGPTKLY